LLNKGSFRFSPAGGSRAASRGGVPGGASRHGSFVRAEGSQASRGASRGGGGGGGNVTFVDGALGDFASGFMGAGEGGDGEEGSAIVITTDAATLDFLDFDAVAFLPQEPPPVLPPGLPPGPPQELPQVES